MLLGSVKDATGSFAAGLVTLAGMLVVGGALVLAVRHQDAEPVAARRPKVRPEGVHRPTV